MASSTASARATVAGLDHPSSVDGLVPVAVFPRTCCSRSTTAASTDGPCRGGAAPAHGRGAGV